MTKFDPGRPFILAAILLIAYAVLFSFDLIPRQQESKNSSDSNGASSFRELHELSHETIFPQQMKVAASRAMLKISMNYRMSSRPSQELVTEYDRLWAEYVEINKNTKEFFAAHNKNTERLKDQNWEPTRKDREQQAYATLRYDPWQLRIEKHGEAILALQARFEEVQIEKGGKTFAEWLGREQK